jgi:hypothetical protein
MRNADADNAAKFLFVIELHDTAMSNITTLIKIGMPSAFIWRAIDGAEFTAIGCVKRDDVLMILESGNENFHCVMTKLGVGYINRSATQIE